MAAANTAAPPAFTQQSQPPPAGAQAVQMQQMQSHTKAPVHLQHGQTLGVDLGGMLVSAIGVWIVLFVASSAIICSRWD